MPCYYVWPYCWVFSEGMQAYLWIYFSVCNQPVDYGKCKKGESGTKETRWYYDDGESKCRKFEYSGCGGNNNNFKSKEKCKKKCVKWAISSAMS